MWCEQRGRAGGRYALLGVDADARAEPKATCRIKIRYFLAYKYRSKLLYAIIIVRHLVKVRKAM